MREKRDQVDKILAILKALGKTALKKRHPSDSDGTRNTTNGKFVLKGRSKPKWPKSTGKNKTRPIYFTECKTLIEATENCGYRRNIIFRIFCPTCGHRHHGEF